MSDKEKAKEYVDKIKRQYLLSEEGLGCAEQGYLDGLAEGKKDVIQWHDVRKEDDYPENKREGDVFYCKLKNETLDMEWYEILIWYIEYQKEDIYRVPVDYMFRSLKTWENVSDYVIAWCELPTYEE